jgi:hypothetical protein
LLPGSVPISTASEIVKQRVTGNIDINRIVAALACKWGIADLAKLLLIHFSKHCLGIHVAAPLGLCRLPRPEGIIERWLTHIHGAAISDGDRGADGTTSDVIRALLGRDIDGVRCNYLYTAVVMSAKAGEEVPLGMTEELPYVSVLLNCWRFSLQRCAAIFCPLTKLHFCDDRTGSMGNETFSKWMVCLRSLLFCSERRVSKKL